MQNNQHNIVLKVLKLLDQADLLDRLVLVGSWRLYFYQEYFEEQFSYSMLRTRDMDFLIPTPLKRIPDVDVPALLEELGFVQNMKTDGTIQLMHPEVLLEFLVAERGRGESGPRPIPISGINAQPLRYMDIAANNSIRIKKDNLFIRLPHPAAFALHKLLIVKRRKESAKGEKDLDAAVSILRLLIKNDDILVLRQLLHDFPKVWVRTIHRTLDSTGHAGLLSHGD